MLAEERELTERAARIETLLDEIDSFPDPAIRAKAADIVESLLVLYGEGLARMLAVIAEQLDGDEGGSQIFEAFARDELVAHLLMLHDLHPIPVETRILQALEEVRPYLQSHGGNVELLGVENGIARLRLQGSCSGCPSSTVTLKLAIEEAIQRACPDLEGIDAEGVVEQPKPVSFVSSADLLSMKPPTSGRTWTAVARPPELDSSAVASVDVSGTPLLLLKLAESHYAYHNACPNCGSALEGGILEGDELACPTCPQRYDVRRAGRSTDIPHLHLQPLPLLVQDGIIKVALANG